MHAIAPLKGKVALVQSLLPRRNFPSVWETLTQEEFDSFSHWRLFKLLRRRFDIVDNFVLQPYRKYKEESIGYQCEFLSVIKIVKARRELNVSKASSRL